MEGIRNKVAESGIIVIDLLAYRPDESSVMELDISLWLQGGFLFREKDFRASVMAVDWAIYAGKHVTICCTTDAIVPYWAFAFVAVQLQSYALSTVMGSKDDRIRQLWMDGLTDAGFAQYQQQKVVLKARNEVFPEIYVKAVTLLYAHAATLMYGEAGSPIVLYKRTTK